MTTTYTYHIARDGQGLKMAWALREFLGVGLDVAECLALTTTRPAVATVIESLFDVRPELRCDDTDLLQTRLDEVSQSDEPRQYDGFGNLLPTFEETQADIAGMKTCPECGLLFVPGSPRQKYCGKKCNSRVANRNYQAKKNGNGHQPASEAVAVVEPIGDQAAVAAVEAAAQPESDPIIELINADVFANQTLRWLIASSGKEVESVSGLLVAGKLALGERLHHKSKGWFVVFQNEAGSVDVRKVEEGE